MSIIATMIMTITYSYSGSGDLWCGSMKHRPQNGEVPTSKIFLGIEIPDCEVRWKIDGLGLRGL